jgi:hypothetical protein
VEKLHHKENIKEHLTALQKYCQLKALQVSLKETYQISGEV